VPTMDAGPSADPFARLLTEHADFVEKLSELEAVLDEMVARREAREEKRELVDEALRFFREELFSHFLLEERVVLPVLEPTLGRYGSLVNVVAYEHDEVRREVAKFAEARDTLFRSPDPWPSIQELNRHGLFTIQFLWDHFRKEKASLFPAAREALSPEELSRIRDGLSRA